MRTRLVNGKQVEMPDAEFSAWLATIPPPPEPEPDKVDILVALLKEKNLITSEDATKVKRGRP